MHVSPRIGMISSTAFPVTLAHQIIIFPFATGACRRKMPGSPIRCPGTRAMHHPGPALRPATLLLLLLHDPAFSRFESFPWERRRATATARARSQPETSHSTAPDLLRQTLSILWWLQKYKSNPAKACCSCAIPCHPMPRATRRRRRSQRKCASPWVVPQVSPSNWAQRRMRTWKSI